MAAVAAIVRAVATHASGRLPLPDCTLVARESGRFASSVDVCMYSQRRPARDYSVAESGAANYGVLIVSDNE